MGKATQASLSGAIARRIEGVRGTGENRNHAGVVGYNTAGGLRGLWEQCRRCRRWSAKVRTGMVVYGSSSTQTGVGGKSVTASGTTGESRDFYGVYGISTMVKACMAKHERRVVADRWSASTTAVGRQNVRCVRVEQQRGGVGAMSALG